MLREEKHVNISSKRLVVLITFSFINILPRFLKRNETKRNETKRNETKRNGNGNGNGNGNENEALP